MASVSIRGLSVGFGSIRVFENLGLDIEQGEFVVLLGPSGCGKSTLLNAIAGLLDIRDGEIWIDGRNVTWEEPKDRGIGMVFQSYALYPRMTVEGNMSFSLKMARLPKPEIAARVRRAAALLHIEDLLHRRPIELSGGQRQRVAIGRALVRDVAVFLFDEPLSNLDAALRAELRVELKRLHRELDATMIYVTHDQVEALTLADRIAVMSRGIIQQFDVPRRIYHEPANKFVAGFVGAPPMNFIPGRLERQGGSVAFVSDVLVQPLDTYAFADAVQPGTPVELGVRPEDIRIGAPNGAGHKATVEMVEPMGSDMVVWASLGGQTLRVRTDGEATVASSDVLDIGFAANRLNVFDAATGRRL